MNKKSRAAQRPRAPAVVNTQFVAILEFSYTAVLCVIETEMDHRYSDDRVVVPEHVDWQLQQACDTGSGCWVHFESDQPFKQEDLDKLLHNVNLMEQAIDLMLE